MSQGLRRTPPAFAVVLCALGAIVVGIAIVYKPEAAVALAAMTLMVPIVLAAPEYCGMALFAWGIVRYPIVGMLGISNATMAAIELAALVLLVVEALRRGQPSWVLDHPYVVGGVVVFVVVALVSWFANAGSLFELVLGLRGYLFIPILAVTLGILLNRPSDYQKFYMLGVGLTALQVPFAAYQYFLGGGRNTDIDFVVGTLGKGAANVLGVWMLGAVLGALMIFLLRPTWRPLVLAAGCVGVIVWSGARVALWLSPLVLIGLLWLTRKSASSLLLRLGLVGVTLMALLGWATFSYQSRPVDQARDTQLIRMVQDQTEIQAGRVPRLGYIAYGIDFMRQNAVNPWLGTGPATSASGAAATLGTPEVTRFSVGMRLIAGGLTSRPQSEAYYSLPLPTQFASMLVEYGPFGIAAYLWFLVAVAVVALRTVAELQAGRSVLTGLLWYFAIFVTLGSVYAVVWESYSLLGMAFWWCVVLIMGLSRLKDVPSLRLLGE